MKLWRITIEEEGLPIIVERLVNEKELRELCYAHGDRMLFEAFLYITPDGNIYPGNGVDTVINYHR